MTIKPSTDSAGRVVLVIYAETFAEQFILRDFARECDNGKTVYCGSTMNSGRETIGYNSITLGTILKDD